MTPAPISLYRVGVRDVGHIDIGRAAGFADLLHHNICVFT
jgi:hypothetical protein